MVKFKHNRQCIKNINWKVDLKWLDNKIDLSELMKYLIISKYQEQDCKETPYDM